MNVFAVMMSTVSEYHARARVLEIANSWQAAADKRDEYADEHPKLYFWVEVWDLTQW